MKTIKKPSLIALIFLVHLSFLNAQDVVEIPYQPYNEELLNLIPDLIRNHPNDDRSIEMSLESLKKFEEPYCRNNIMEYELADHYANKKQYDKCLEILAAGHKEGRFYHISEKYGTPIPSYLPELKKLKKYQSFLERNNFLKDSANKVSKTEYMVQLPDNYDQTIKYPLFLIMHGGGNCIQAIQYWYNTAKLQQNCIVAYFQGSIKEGSYSRVFNQKKWADRIKEGYEQIVQNYPIDTSNVILAGPSSEGGQSVYLGLNHIVSAKGLLELYPYISENDSTIQDDAVIKNSAIGGIKIALLTRKHGWAINQHKEVAFKLDKYGIANRFIIFPGTGNGLPQGYKYHIDTSIDYLLKQN